MNGGLARLGRAAGAATLSTLAALTLHTVAGGHAPALAAVLVPWGASFAVAVQLSGRPLGRLRLALIAVLSQLAFHALFSLGSGAAPTVTGGHHGAVAVTPGASADALHAHAASMPTAHVLAALITYVGIRRASVITAALAGLLTTIARALRPLLAPAVRTWALPRIVATPATPAARPHAGHHWSRPLRGPPLAA